MVLQKSSWCAVIALCFQLLALPALAGDRETIRPEEATRHAGQSMTVCGAVANTYYSRFAAGGPTFINFGKPYPRHVFSIAVMAEDRDKFEQAPEKLFREKDLCVTGLIETYDDKPLIVVRDPSQIRWRQEPVSSAGDSPAKSKKAPGSPPAPKNSPQ